MKSKYLPILIFGCLAIGVLLGGMLNYPMAGPVSAPKNAYRSKLNRLIDFIENEYVDKIDADSIVDLTVNNMLANLDPHSVYITPKAQSEESELMKGDFVGIGVNFYMYRDTVAIIRPIENGPSAKAGLLAGDRILYSGKTKLFGRKLPSDSLFSKLKGAENSRVDLTIYRKAEHKTFHVTITRRVVPIPSVLASVMLNPQTGYIKIDRFAESTGDEFHQALLSLKQKGMQTLVVDLRGNGGGYMEMAARIADEFLPDKSLIVFTKNRKGRLDKTFATAEGNFETGKLFVLIDENSASASEILAGAIQDNDRGTIVGRRSFGKGLVQREMDFEDGSAVRLTVARYYTPSGRSIQKHYDRGDEESYYNEFDKRFENGELYDKDSIKIADTLKFRTRSGRIVYGGGGIVPDIFVPIEAQHGEEGIAYLMQSGAAGQFVFEQIDRNRRMFQALNFDALIAKLSVSDQYFDAFQHYVSASGMKADLSHNKALVRRYLAAEFARQLFDENKYYEVALKGDPMIGEVLKR